MMIFVMKALTKILVVGLLAFPFLLANAAEPEIRTPTPPAEPRINGPDVFGVRPGSPFLYTIPATGDRPIQFGVNSLPSDLTLDPATGQITGTLKKPGT